MAKSAQEEAVKNLSSIIFGGMSLMRPDLYRTPAKEPADLAWVFDRCAFLVNMTSGKKSFEQKRRHNFNQLQTWMRRWSIGEVLKGSTILSIKSYSYADIDHVIGISIVGGPESGNIYESQQVNFINQKTKSVGPKLRAAVTITDNVLQHMVRYKFSARDFLSFIEKLKKEDRAINDEECKCIIDDWIARTSHHIRNHFGLLDAKFEELNKNWVNTRSMFLAATNQNTAGEAGFIFADLRVVDLIWFGVAENVLRSKLSPRGTFGVTALEAEWISGEYKIVCSVCDVIGNFPLDRFDKKSAHNTIRLITYYDLGRDYPLHMWTIPKEFPGESMTRRQIMQMAEAE